MSKKQTLTHHSAALNDTSAGEEVFLIERLASMTTSERMKRFFLLYKTARSFSVAGLCSRYPDCSEEDLKKRKAALFLGRDYAIKTYGWDPDRVGY